MTSDEKIKAAYDRLIVECPGRSDDQLTVIRICTAAGVSRASFYRSVHADAIRRSLAGLQPAAGPTSERAGTQLAKPGRTAPAPCSQHSREIRQLNETVAAYANQIQLLALRVSQLEEDNLRLAARQQADGGNVSALPRRP